MSIGFFALFDDIESLLADVAVSAQQASGFSASRELPVLWAITKGSFVNKLIILPIAFLLSAYASWIIIPILMLGGVYGTVALLVRMDDFGFKLISIAKDTKPLMKKSG